ncbi:hypothetical protein ACU686_15160 [Yinghuangia aomiensis]
MPFAFAGAGTDKVLLMAALFVRGLGLGAATIPLTGAAYTGLAREEMPHASIIVRVSQQIGGSASGPPCSPWSSSTRRRAPGRPPRPLPDSTGRSGGPSRSRPSRCR